MPQVGLSFTAKQVGQLREFYAVLQAELKINPTYRGRPLQELVDLYPDPVGLTRLDSDEIALLLEDEPSLPEIDDFRKVLAECSAGQIESLLAVILMNNMRRTES